MASRNSIASAVSESPTYRKYNLFEIYSSRRHDIYPLPASHLPSALPDPAQPAPSAGASGNVTPTRGNRHSMGPRIGTFPENSARSSLISSPASSEASRATPRLQSSYSTNDIPTVSNAGSTAAQSSVASPQERLHNHNASLGRIPTGAVRSNRNSRDLNELTRSPEMRTEDTVAPSIQSVLQSGSSNGNVSSASAPPTSAGINTSTAPSAFTQQSFTGFNSNAAFYGGYGMNGHVPPGAGSPAANGVNIAALVNGMGHLNMNNSQAYGSVPNMFSHQAVNPQAPYSGYNPYQQAQHYSQGQHNRGGNFQPRRTPGEEQARYQNIPLESLTGEIYGLCRDQHGCRYLQKKLEEGRPENTLIIFNEVNTFMFELMTDPFGNYLVQKLLEQCTEAQRTTLIDNASSTMIHIAFNQHGTRALQKMIDFVTTPAQVSRVIESLQPNVVGLIQDLNGNHVIQKCLNRLSSKDAQFIFESVGTECVRVGTHRHGCCVIQRCIDHAQGEQKAKLVLAIVGRADQLVGDPFGNYVLQYIFEQGEEVFSTPLCHQFQGSMASYSKQKFSSNVVEKAIRIANDETKAAMIHELVYSPEFESVADDAFGNYVLQTAWDHAKGDDEHALVEKIRPLLARGMRTKPHGRRFATRLAEHDQRAGVAASQAPTTAPSGMAHLGYGPGASAGAYSGQHSYGQNNQPSGVFQARPTSSHSHSLNGTASPAYSGYTTPNGYAPSLGGSQYGGSMPQMFSPYGQGQAPNSGQWY